MYTQINRDLEKRHIMSGMVGLMVQLEKLSPHPDRPNYRGAMFTALPGWCKAPGEHDALAGQLLIQGILGGAFAQAASSMSETAGQVADIANVASTALEAYEIYKKEICPKETDAQRAHKAAHGQGTLARMSGTSISKSFNLRGSISTAMQNFLDDMPARLKIENQLASLLKKLKALDIPVYEPVAATARFAA